MANAKKSITGTDDLLKKVFDSPEMDDVVSRMRRVQSESVRPEPPSQAARRLDQERDQGTYQAIDQPRDNTLSHGISNGPSDDPTVCPTVHPLVRPIVHPTSDTTHGTTTDTSRYPTHGTSHYPTQRNDNAAHPIFALTSRQAAVLFYLINQSDCIAQKGRISSETDIPLPTVKHCINALVKDGYISKPVKYVNRSFQGFSYTINQGLCRQFIEKRGHEFTSGLNYPTYGTSSYPSAYPSSGMSNGLSHGSSLHYSSSLESNSTTTDLGALLTTDPELGYWQDKGLQPQQVQKWMEETGMGQILMIQSLKYCRFDMVDNNQEENKPVQNVFNWFYSIIKRTGHYPKPAGYKSWAEKLFEVEKSLLEEQEAEVRRMEELRLRRYKLEIDRKFLDLMNDPGSETYQRVFERLSPLEKQLGEGISFEKAMRRRFEELLETAGS